VLVGRPMAIAAVGGEISAVKYLLSRYGSELKKTMSICGTQNISSINEKYIIKIKNESAEHNVFEEHFQ